jgi:hypothetical protein
MENEAENITLVLHPQHINMALAALKELPYKLSRPAIAEIEKQLKEWEERHLNKTKAAT